MRVRFIAPLTAAAIAASLALFAGPAAAAPAPAAATAATPRATMPSSVPITGTATDALGTVSTVSGTFTPTSFSTSNGQLVANGLLSGSVTDAAGTVTQTITSQAVSMPVTAAMPQASCTILNLVLGPLHLNLLGLVIDLNQVVLTITAVPGPGNLLGNLLCSVANLLNGGLSAGGLATLLNQLLGLLGGL